MRDAQLRILRGELGTADGAGLCMEGGFGAPASPAQQQPRSATFDSVWLSFRLL